MLYQIWTMVCDFVNDDVMVARLLKMLVLLIVTIAAARWHIISYTITLCAVYYGIQLVLNGDLDEY